jgi:Domain of unknown function (DUF4394)
MRKLLLTALLVLGLGPRPPSRLAPVSTTHPAVAGRSSRSWWSASPPTRPWSPSRPTTPGRVTTLGRVRGLARDRRLVGLDCRVADHTAYGVGDRGGIYRLRDATATKVSQLTVPLQGRSFDVDFNPAANRLRVISDRGQNLRHNLDDPTGTPQQGSPSPTPP